MKNNNIHNDDTIFLAKWMVNEITDTDFKELVSDTDFLAYKKLKEGILLYEKLEEPIDGSFKEIQHKIDTRNKTKVRKLYTKWAISIAASIVLFFGINTFLGNDSVINSTKFGEQKTIALLDGSEVILSAKSEIKYNKKDWESNRELYLDGEAFFKVKKGSKFIVKTNNGDVSVLGTEFNVNSNNDLFEVICYTGKVKVTNNNKTHILTPSLGVRNIKNNTISLKINENKPSWVIGERTYKSIPLKFVISDLEKQFKVKFDKTKINEDSLFTGSFNNKNKQLAFTTVFKAMNISFKESNNIIILVKK